MKEYILFLDETKPMKNNPFFCFGGCIIEKSVYENNVCAQIVNLKNNVFNKSDIILHAYDIKKNNGEFIILKNRAKRDEFWNGLIKIIDTNEMNFMAAYISLDEYKKMYLNEYSYDVYYITLQIILQNFTCFLAQNSGIGQIFIEGRSPEENKVVNSYFYKLLANGTAHINKYGLQKYLMSIAFLPKADNNIGLQIADFVPSTLIRYLQNRSSIYNLDQYLLNKLYSGPTNNINKYGIVNAL